MLLCDCCVCVWISYSKHRVIMWVLNLANDWWKFNYNVPICFFCIIFFVVPILRSQNVGCTPNKLRIESVHFARIPLTKMEILMHILRRWRSPLESRVKSPRNRSLFHYYYAYKILKKNIIPWRIHLWFKLIGPPPGYEINIFNLPTVGSQNWGVQNIFEDIFFHSARITCFLDAVQMQVRFIGNKNIIVYSIQVRIVYAQWIWHGVRAIYRTIKSTEFQLPFNLFQEFFFPKFITKMAWI